MPPVTNFFQAMLVAVTASLTAVLAFIPALVGAGILLAVGWGISGALARVVTTVLERVGFETAAQRTGATEFITRIGVRDARASRVIGELTKWFIRLIFLEAAAQALKLSAVTQVLNQVVLFIPNLAVALVVLMVGALLSRLVAGLVRSYAMDAGLASAEPMATLARYTVITVAVIVALSQIGVAATIVNTLFAALAGALALAFGLAFGLGGREVAAELWRRWFTRSAEMTSGSDRPAAVDAGQGERSRPPARVTAPQPGRRRSDGGRSAPPAEAPGDPAQAGRRPPRP